jgi:hypothetical protein
MTLSVNGVQADVLGEVNIMAVAIADAVDINDVVIQFNALLAALRDAHLISE